MTPFTWLDGEHGQEIVVSSHIFPLKISYLVLYQQKIILFLASLSSYLRKVNTTVMSNGECQSVYGTAGVTDSDICSRGTNLVGICSVRHHRIAS